MAQKYNSAGRKLYAKQRVADGVILQLNATWPNAVDDSPIVGDTGEVVYLPIDEDAVEAHDARLFKVVTTQGPEGSIYKIARVITAKSQEELEAVVLGAENARNLEHIPAQEQLKQIIISLGVIFRVLGSQTLTAKEVAIRQRTLSIAAVFLKHDQRAAHLKAALLAGQTPDLDAGWETPS